MRTVSDKRSSLILGITLVVFLSIFPKTVISFNSDQDQEKASREGLQNYLSRSRPERPHIVIGPQKKELIWIEGNSSRDVILSVDQLPTQSSIAKGLTLGRKEFSKVISSPGRDLIAFGVDGFHGWCGLYDISRKELKEIAFFFQGRVTGLSFSPNGDYLAIENVGGSGLSSLFLWNVKKACSPRWEVTKDASNFPCGVLLQKWTDSALQVLLYWPNETVRRQTWLLEINGCQVFSKRLELGD